MTAAPEWFLWALLALCFVCGWLQGSLWRANAHLKDLRSHIKWTEEFTAEVNSLLEHFAAAIRRSRDEDAA